MTQRYVTEGDKAGLKRRMEDYRTRLKETGISARQLLLTDAETARVRAIVALWRTGKANLPEELKTAALALKPESVKVTVVRELPK